MDKREEKTMNLILALLNRQKDGMTIISVADALSIHYTTASKYLAVLEAQGKVFHRNIGMAKVFRLRESVENEIK